MKKKVLLIVMILVVCVSLLCACGETQSNIDPSDPLKTDTKQEQTESGKQEETENKTTENATAYPKPNRENKDILTKYTVNFAEEIKKAYFVNYGDGNVIAEFSVANEYGHHMLSDDKGIQYDTYVFFAKVGKEAGKTVEETVAGITFSYQDNYKMSVYDSKSKTLCDMPEPYEKGWLTANDIKRIKHKCDMDDFAAGDGLFLLEAYDKFLGRYSGGMHRMEILDYFGVYHGVHVAVIDPHYGLTAANYPQYDISGYWFYGIQEGTFVAYKDGEMKYMCAPAEKGWYTVIDWFTEEDIADINKKHLQHLDCNYD